MINRCIALFVHWWIWAIETDEQQDIERFRKQLERQWSKQRG